MTERSVTISGLDLQGDLEGSRAAKGLVVFVHGSGSSRLSPRNRQVAAALRARGLATLLFDLLTKDEERAEQAGARRRFDIPLLARRLEEVTRWVQRQPEGADVPVGYFGASTGAAAALVAAAQEPDGVRAIVSRGGRPDLAGDALAKVAVPVLLVVGSRDADVLALNRQAQARLRGPTALHVVPGATHLFEEPGTLDEAARVAGDWFLRWFAEAAP